MTLDRRGILFLAVGHAIGDITQGSIPALIPFLIQERGLSYVAASGVLLAATILSSILQPLLGFYSDRRSSSWLIPLGIFASGIGIGLSGLSENYVLILASVIICGIGVSTFHPESYRFAYYFSGKQRAAGTSYFNLGGSIGFAIGPLIMTAGLLAFGLKGTMLMAVPTTLIAVLIWFELPRFKRVRQARTELSAGEPAAANHWGAFVRLSVLIIMRSAFYYGFSGFLSSYMLHVKNFQITEANGSLSVMAIAGTVGTLLSGVLADRYGTRRTLMLALLLYVPGLWGVINLGGLAAMACIALLGAASGASFTVAVVLGQEYAPASLGIASGVTTGLANGLGSLSTPLLGAIADAQGLQVMFPWLYVLPIVSLAMGVTLPKRLSDGLTDNHRPQPAANA